MSWDAQTSPIVLISGGGGEGEGNYNPLTCQPHRRYNKRSIMIASTKSSFLCPLIKTIKFTQSPLFHYLLHDPPSPPLQSPTDPQENDYVTPLSVDLAKEVKYKAEAAV